MSFLWVNQVSGNNPRLYLFELVLFWSVVARAPSVCLPMFSPKPYPRNLVEKPWAKYRLADFKP